MLSPDGRSYAFDRRANGFGRGEGFVAVILKRACDAVADNDCIRAIIRATHTNQNGFAAAGITRTNQQAQELLIKSAYLKADLEMSPTMYVEAHGTGTGVGDPIEANAIGMTFRKRRAKDQILYV